MHQGYGCVWRVHREDCPTLGLTCRQPQGVHTHRTHAQLTVYADNGNACALGRVARPSRDQAPPADHSLGLHGFPHDPRCRPVSRPGLHTCAPCRRLAGRRVPDEWKSKVLRSPLLSSCTASHASPHCTQACPSTGTSHVDSQRAKPSDQAM